MTLAPPSSACLAGPAAAAVPADPADLLLHLLDSAPDAALLVGSDGTVHHASTRAAGLLWRDPADCRGRCLADLVAPEYRARLGERVEWTAAVGGRRAAGFKVALLHPDGAVTPVRIWLADAGIPGRVVVWLREIEPREDAGVPAAIAEINDAVLQDLAAASYAHQRGQHQDVADAIGRAALGARRILRSLPAPFRASRPRRAATGEAAGAVDPGTARASAHRGVVRTLLADDSAVVRAQVQAVLASIEGVEIVGVAADGVEAVEAARRLRPHLVLCDLSMPRLDGLGAIRAMRRDDPEVRIVALSGYAGAQVAGEALRHGASAYLEKGGALSRFAAVIDQLFPERTRAGALSVPVSPAARGGDPDLVALYAHELRTPLTTQLLCADLLLEGDTLVDADRRLVERARGSGRRLQQLVEAMVDAGRAGAGSLNIVVEPVELALLVHRVTGDLGHLLTRDRLLLRQESGGWVAADPLRVSQVLENVVCNAAKFGPADAPIEVTLRAVEDRMEIDVADHGPGIPTAERERVFERFARLDRRAPGLGLGLYLAREIARAHGGDLQVLEQGTTPGATFRFSLPQLRG